MSIWDVGGQKRTITIDQAVSYAKQAGFSGVALINAVAIAIAESGLDANSTNSTTSGVGVDRGIVKFNSVFHREVPDSCAYDPACAFREMYRVSQGGKSFCEWCTYNRGCANPCNSNGPYLANIPMVTAAVNRSGPTGTGTVGNIPGAGVALSPTSAMLPSSFLPDIGNFGEHIAVFLLALAFILAGLYLVAQKQIAGATQGAVDAALRLTV